MAMDLGKQIGPLPLGAWIVVVAGGLGLAYYSYRQSEEEPEIVEDVSTTPGVGTGAVGGWVPQAPPTEQPASGSGPVTTNEEWGVRAINWLIQQNYPADVADSAIRKYLAGNTGAVSVNEYTLQRIALAKWGSPPQPLPPSGATPGTRPIPQPPKAVPRPVKPKPKPAKKKPQKKSSGRWVVVKPWPRKLSTLSGIADHAYGNRHQWRRIYNANRKGVKRPNGSRGMITNPNKIYPGWRLYIP